MLEEQISKTLYIDSKNQHLDDENGFVIHPQKIHLLSLMNKGIFKKVIINNTPAELLKGMSFFYIAQVLEDQGLCEVLVDQPISVMQRFDANEIETNAKIGGFNNIESSDYENWIQEKGNDIQIQTIKITMVKEEKKKI